MKNIVLLNGHPNADSFNQALFESYLKGAKEAEFTVATIEISKLTFNPNLEHGYQKRMDWEPDLEEAWEKIQKADHLVWIHPVWWGGLPAKTKGFIDRIFLPGLTFKPRPNSIWWDKLLVGKTARIITTMDQPGWFYRWFNKQPSVHQLKKSTLEFCGVKPVKVTYLGPVKSADEAQRKKWMNEIYQLGKKGQ